MNKINLQVPFNYMRKTAAFLNKVNKLNLKTTVINDGPEYWEVEFIGTKTNLIEFINKIYSPNDESYALDLIECIE